MAKKISPGQFADNLAKEWAALPYGDTGRSYYDRDGINRSGRGLTRDMVISQLPAAANGAVISPRSGGTLVQVGEAGQSEAIVPLPDGRSIPVVVKNSSEQAAAMNDLFMAMTARLDTMVSLLSVANKYSRNIAQNTV
jgi:hypothetical protein